MDVPVVELGFRLICEMSEAVPLRAALSVEGYLNNSLACVPILPTRVDGN